MTWEVVEYNYCLNEDYAHAELISDSFATLLWATTMYTYTCIDADSNFWHQELLHEIMKIKTQFSSEQAYLSVIIDTEDLNHESVI